MDNRKLPLCGMSVNVTRGKKDEGTGETFAGRFATCADYRRYDLRNP